MTPHHRPEASTGPRFIIYGATGYTGRLIAHVAKERKLNAVLAGRDAVKLNAMSDEFGFSHRVHDLRHEGDLDQALGDIEVLVNAAGPFSSTARPVSNACLRTGTHYVDVTGEIPVYQALARRDPEVRRREIMIMPGVGFAVVASDCLAALAAKRLPDAHRLRIGISRSSLFSRGSAKTMIELFEQGIKIRRDGELISVPIGSLEHYFDFGSGRQPALAVSWPDVITAFYTTGIPNIESYFEVGPLERALALCGRYSGWMFRFPVAQQMLKIQTQLLPEGPSDYQRSTHNRIIVAEVENPSGESIRLRLTTPESYAFTAISTLDIVERILRGELRAGFQTPAQVYGAELVLGLKGVSLEELN